MENIINNNISQESIFSKTNKLIGINEYKTARGKLNEENKNDDNNIMISNNHNKLIDSKEFYFNYRNDAAFNQINNLETKLVNKKYNNESVYFNSSFNNINNFSFENKYNNNMSINNESDYKNNLIKEEPDTNLKDSNNNKINDIAYCSLKNSVNSIDSNKMREISMEDNEIQKQIKYEEKMLNELKEEKRKLIEEDKKRREMILLEINNNKKEITNKKEEIKEILNECKIEKNQLKKNALNMDYDYNIQNNNYKENESNYYKEYLENIKERNELINKKSQEIISCNINKENINNNIAETYKSEKIFDKNLIKTSNKKEENKESYSNYKKLKNYNINNNSMYNSYKKMNYNCSCPNDPSLKINLNKRTYWSVKRKKEKIDKINKIDLYSYFKLNKKEKNFNENKENNKTTIKKNNNYLTPNGLYRDNKTNNSIDSTTQVYKVLSSNDNNNYFMTQTRFYRGKINPDELSSNYAKEKVIETTSNMDRSYNRNKNIYSFPEMLNYSKDYFENYKINQSATNLMSLIDNKNLIKANNSGMNKEIYFNYSNNLFPKDIKRLSCYKSNSFLEKPKTYSNTKFVEIKNNKRSFNNNKYLCGHCFKNIFY